MGNWKNITLSESDRFNKSYKINQKTGCWENHAALKKNRYGTITFNGVHIVAHRASYMKYIGEIPEGLKICHRCDNKPCCNPFHLFLGTQKDNMQDAQSKGIIPTAPHPSHSAYVGGCRCLECKALNTEYNKKWRALQCRA